MADTDAPPVDDAQGTDEQEGPKGIAAALEQARTDLKERGSLFPEETSDEESAEEHEAREGQHGDGAGDEDERPDADLEGSESLRDGIEDDGEPEPEEQGDEELADDEDADEQADDGEEFEDEAGEEPGESEEAEEGEGESFTALLPGRGPDDEDIEIEVSDQATADRLNQLRNGYMRGEEFRAGLAEVQAAQEELFEIEEQFGVDPAGFILQHVDEEHLAQVALSLVVDPKAWKAVQATLTRLIDNPNDLRTLQAETKAARLETRDALKEARAARAEQNKNAAALTTAINNMVPEEMGDAKRDRLIRDMTRDVVEHIERNNVEKMDPKDLVTVLADRLELNGIDPLEARDAVKNGRQTRGKPSTRKKKVRGKPKSGKQLAKASAKRRRAAAAPGAGKAAAPTQPKALPRDQTIQERISEVRKRGLGSILGR